MSSQDMTTAEGAVVGTVTPVTVCEEVIGKSLGAVIETIPRSEDYWREVGCWTSGGQCEEVGP